MSAYVRVYHWMQFGAPVLTSSAGSALALFQAVLVNGYGEYTISSMSVTSAVASATTSAVHGLSEGDIVIISGATPAGLNGEKQVNTVTGTTFKFSATGIANTTATGTMKVKRAPLGWSETVAATNVSLFRSNNSLSAKRYLRMDDSVEADAAYPHTFVRGVTKYNSPTDYVGLFPNTEGQISNTRGLIWPRCSANYGTSAPWVIIGDDRFFYYWVLHDSSAALYGFGDYAPMVKSTVGSCVIFGEHSTPHYSPKYSCIDAVREWAQDSVIRGAYIAKASDSMISKRVGVVNSHLDRKSPNGYSGISTLNPIGLSINYPLNGKIYIHENGNPIGTLPGGISLGAELSHMTVMEEVVHARINGGNRAMALNSTGVILVDVTGPWSY